MVDIETLGTGVDSTIIQISAIAFDIETGKELSVFNQIADISKNENMKVDGSTIKWWLNTDKELLHTLLNSGDLSSDDVLELFHKWLKGHALDMKFVYLWGNGILFDNKMIEHQMKNIGLDYPIFYRNDRDVRTIVDLTCARRGITEQKLKDSFKDYTLVAHNALDDVRFQIRLVTSCYHELVRESNLPF